MNLVDKISETFLADAYYGTFVAPEQFGKYCGLDDFYRQCGVVSERFIESPCNMPIKELAQYYKKIRAWFGDCCISRQENMGSCGFRVVSPAHHASMCPPELESIVYIHTKNMVEQNKNILILLVDKCSQVATKGIVDLRYADEPNECFAFGEDWLMKQNNSSCICYIIPKYSKSCMTIRLVYKDVQSVEQGSFDSSVLAKLYRYNFYMKKQGMTMEK